MDVKIKIDIPVGATVIHKHDNGDTKVVLDYIDFELSKPKVKKIWVKSTPEDLIQARIDIINGIQMLHQRYYQHQSHK